MRVFANVLVALMLGSVYFQAGNDGSKVLDNYNLLFSILMHHMMSTMMLTILTCKLKFQLKFISFKLTSFLVPNEMSILIKEHFNRWYSLKMYYTALTLVDIPVSVGLHYFLTYCLMLMFLSIFFRSCHASYSLE